MKPIMKVVLPVAVVAVLGGGWFGWSMYANKEADRRVSAWLYKNDLDPYVRYRAVKASPFGGKATLHDVEIVAGDDAASDGPSLRIARLSVSDMQDDDKLKAGTLDLAGVRLSEAAMANMMFVQSTGRRSLEPIDLRLSAKLDIEKGELDLVTDLDAPDMAVQTMQLTLGGLRGLDDFVTELRQTIAALGLDMERDSDPYRSSRRSLDQGSRGFQPENVTLVNLDLTIRDRGAFRRSAAIRNRYGISLDPGAGDAARQRKKIAAQNLERLLLDCEKEMRAGGEPAIGLCQAGVRLIAGDSKGLKLRIRPDDRIRLMDLVTPLAEDNMQQAVRMVRRLNLSAESL